LLLLYFSRTLHLVVSLFLERPLSSKVPILPEFLEKRWKKPWKLYVVGPFTLQNVKFKPAHLLFSRKRDFLGKYFFNESGLSLKWDFADKILCTNSKNRDL
uniref:Uncharacterized protein n=1 Tax=Romanomermis culicivorax TaxID=13658 RepID=A0A915KD50_ROMCU